MTDIHCVLNEVYKQIDQYMNNICSFRTSLFIVCSLLYGILLVVVCVVFLTAELVTDSVPLHYFEVY